MKRLIFATLLLMTLNAAAQTVDMRRKIEVSGVAETEVTPDIIYFGIELKEYMDGRTRISIDQLETQLEKAVEDAGIPKENFTINNIAGYTTYQKRKDPNFLASKQYTIKLQNLNKINQILNSLDVKAIVNTEIESDDYSKMPELKKELKLKALVAAKEKAEYLLNGIGEKLGGVIAITEIEGGEDNYALRNKISNVSYGYLSKTTTDSNIDYKKIKLKFEIKAVFEIASK